MGAALPLFCFRLRLRFRSFHSKHYTLNPKPFKDSSSHPEACQEGDGAGGDDAGSVFHLGCGNGLRQRDAVYHHQQQQGEQQQQVAEGLLHGNACFECRG